MTADATERQDRLWTRQTWPFICSVLALMTFIAFESFAVATVLPVAIADLGDVGWYSFAYAATITTGLIGMVIGGTWADLSGPRTPLIIGGTVFLVGLLLNVIAIDVTTFILGRLLQGVGGGIDSVVLYVLIAKRIPEGSRPQMFGLLTTAWLVPSLAGPLIAGALAELISWRAVFGIVLLGSAAALLSLLRTAAGPGEGPRSSAPPAKDGWTAIIGRRGMLAVLAAALLVALHLSRELSAPLSAAVVAAASLALVAAARGILPAGTLTLRGLPQRLIIVRAILGATVTATDLYLTLYLQTERGYPPTTAGLVIAIAAGGWALGAWFQGRFSSTLATHRRLVVLATVLVVTGPVTVFAYTATGLPLWAVVVACVLMGTGMGTAYPRLSSATLALARPDQQGGYSSALQTGESMGIGAVTALTAAVLTGGGTFGTIYLMLTGLACLAFVIAALTGGRSLAEHP